MTNQETNLQQEIRLAVGQIPNLRLFRNQVGQLPHPITNRYVQFGLAIGFKTVKITEDMVGTNIAQFISLEVKTNTGRISKIQQNWLTLIKNSGGISGVVRSIDDAIKILNLK